MSNAEILDDNNLTVRVSCNKHVNNFLEFSGILNDAK